MPRTKTAKKELRKNVRRRAQNLSRQKRMRTSVKTYQKLVIAGDLDGARANLPQVMQTLDKLAKVGYIKRGKADRMKSRLAKKLKAK
ncbi:MAG: 30S ribosomal protein S20 [bacterium]|nr:30S ribosomal protein S20 [bacterium]